MFPLAPVVMVVHAGKKLLGRSQVRSVAEKRRDKLNDYCQVCGPEHPLYVVDPVYSTVGPCQIASKDI